jgi:hypothetical protein
MRPKSTGNPLATARNDSATHVVSEGDLFFHEHAFTCSIALREDQRVRVILLEELGLYSIGR